MFSKEIFVHAVRFHISIFKSHTDHTHNTHKPRPRPHPTPPTLPAGSYSELHVDLRGVDGPVICHQVRVIGHAVHIQSHHWEINADDVIMPLLITDLREREEREKFMIFLLSLYLLFSFLLQCVILVSFIYCFSFFLNY